MRSKPLAPRLALLLAGVIFLSGPLYAGKRTPDKVLNVYTATWCAACLSEKAAVAKWAQTNNVRVVWIDADKYPHLHKQAGVRSLPTYDYMIDGVRQWRAYTVRKF